MRRILLISEIKSEKELFFNSYQQSLFA